MSKIFLPAQKPKKLTKIVSAIFVFLLCTTALVIPVVMAYFTATCQVEGDMQFGNLQASFTNSSGTIINSSNFQSQLIENVTPGDTLKINTIKVKNSGNIDEYALLKLNVEITKSGQTTLKYKRWYNLEGTEVNTTNFAVNTTGATYLSVGDSQNVDIDFVLPGNEINNNYKSATATVNFSVHSVQHYLPESSSYSSKANFASYFIIKEFDDLTTSEAPLRKLVGKNLYPYNIDASKYITIDHYSARTTSTFDANGITINAVNATEIDTAFKVLSQVFELPSNTECTLSFKLKNVLNKSFYMESKDPSGWSTYLVDSQGKKIYATKTASNSVSALTTATVSFTFKTNNSTTYQLSLGTDIPNITGSGCYITLSNIQIEVGTEKTAYEAYNLIEDTFDSSTHQLTRRVGELVCTGEERWNTDSVNTQANLDYGYAYVSVPIKEYTRVSCTHLPYLEWSSLMSNRNQRVVSTTTVIVLNMAKSEIGYTSSSDYLTKWKAYIANEYANGHPITFRYQLQTPVVTTV